MKYYFVVSGLIIFLSFVLGTVISEKINLRKYGIITNSPIGFLSLMAILQLGYYFITILKMNTEINIYYTLLVFGIIIVMLFIFIKDIFNSIKRMKNHLFQIAICLVMFLVLVYIFSRIKFNYRVDDMNFYGSYIPKRVSESFFLTSMSYDYQALYVFISALLKIFSIVFSTTSFNNLLPLGFILWVPAIITLWIFSISFVDIYGFIKSRINGKLLPIFILVFATLIIFSDQWYFAYPHFGVVMKKLPVLYIFILLLSKENNSFAKKWLFCILFGALISFSSTGFFLSVMVIYGWMVSKIFNKDKNFVVELLIISLFPVSYAIAYNILFLPIVILIYVIPLGFLIFNRIEIFEELLYKIRFLILFCIPIVFSLVGILNLIPESYVNVYLANREFFTPINSFDMVNELLVFVGRDFGTIIFNILFWGLLLTAIIISKKNYVLNIIAIILLTFYNPFVYKFVGVFITNTAFFRISDLFFNIIVIIEVISVLLNYNLNKIYKSLLIIILIIMSTIRVYKFRLPLYVNETNDYNVTYHASNSEIEIMQKLEMGHFLNDNRKVKIASQLYGAQLFTHKWVQNTVEDRFSYAVIDSSEYEQVFARRYPGYDLPDANYDKACSLAFSKNTEFVILDAQYNYELQDGLWPCSYVLFESGVYRVLKLDYDYWRENVDLGYTVDYGIPKGE